MLKTIYIAGGCFWGVQEYYSRLLGVKSTKSGYANGKKENPTYQEVRSGIYQHAETVEIIYNNSVISLEKLLEHYLRFVDPYSVNKQGEDEGIQYRTGIYYLNKEDKDIVEAYFKSIGLVNHKIEILPLKKFFLAEEYHQKYLDKNPTGYCHINMAKLRDEERK